MSHGVSKVWSDQEIGMLQATVPWALRGFLLLNVTSALCVDHWLQLAIQYLFLMFLDALRYLISFDITVVVSFCVLQI